MAYVKNPKIIMPKPGRPKREKNLVPELDEITLMATQLGIDQSVRRPLTWKLRPGQVFRYGRIWENVADRWCPTPVVPDESQWVDSPKVKIPDFMASWDRGKQETPEQAAFITQEKKRIWNTGVFIRRSRNRLSWVTPWHYGVLNYWQMNLDTDDGMKEYRDKDRRKWLHFGTGYKHPKCFGWNYLKRRRDGGSIDGGFFTWWVANKRKLQFSGIMSYDEDHGNESFVQNVRNPFYELPLWLMAIHSTTPKSMEVEFTSPAKRNTVNQREIYRDESLKSWIKTKAPSERGFDGRKMGCIWFTEAGKLTKISVRKWLNINKLTVKEGPTKVGFILIETTCDELKGGGEEFKKIYQAGKVLRENGSTENDTWSIFIPAYDGYQGFVDQEGESIIDYPTDTQWAYMQSIGHTERIGAKEYQARERKKLDNSPDDLIEYIRKEPWTEEEAFDSSNTECHFDLQNLSLLKAAIQDVGEETLWQQGNFFWMDSSRTRVGWRKDEINGRFCVSWFPPDEGMSNNVILNRDGWTPGNKKLGVLGLDPFNNAVIKNKKRGSMGGMTGYLYFDYKSEAENKKFKERFHMDRSGYWPTPSVFLRYVNRPASMTVFYEDVLMACWFYGLPLANERQINKIEMYFAQKNCLPFLLSAAEMKGGVDTSNEDYNLYGLPMSDDLSWNCIEIINTFLNGDGLHFRDAQYKIYDDPRRLPFLEAVTNLMTFRNDNRTVADWVMSLMQAVKAEEGIMDLSNPFQKTTRDVSTIFGGSNKNTLAEEDSENRWQIVRKYRDQAIVL